MSPTLCSSASVPVRAERVTPTIMISRRLHSLQRRSPQGICSMVAQQQKWKLRVSVTWRHWKSCIQPTAHPRDSSGWHVLSSFRHCWPWGSGFQDQASEALWEVRERNRIIKMVRRKMNRFLPVRGFLPCAKHSVRSLSDSQPYRQIPFHN